MTPIKRTLPKSTAILREQVGKTKRVAASSESNKPESNKSGRAVYPRCCPSNLFGTSGGLPYLLDSGLLDSGQFFFAQLAAFCTSAFLAWVAVAGRVEFLQLAVC
jgi:hypothetical protein